MNSSVSLSSRQIAIDAINDVSLRDHFSGVGNDVFAFLSSLEERYTSEIQAEQCFEEVCGACPASGKCSFMGENSIPKFIQAIKKAGLNGEVARSLVDMCTEKRLKLQAALDAELQAIVSNSVTETRPKFDSLAEDDFMSPRVALELYASGGKSMRDRKARMYGTSHQAFFGGVPVRHLMV